MRRIPLWATFVPLLVGVLGYHWWWAGHARGFAADVARLVPGRTVAIGGFPYRLEADVDAPVLAYHGPGLEAAFTARTAEADRGPWQPALTVVRSTVVHLQLAVPPLTPARFDLTAPAALSSIHLAGTRLARLSTVFDRPQAIVALLPVPLSADRFEVHVRDLGGERSTGATLPDQAQVVLAGTGVRLGGGAPLTLAADIALTAAQPIRSYAAWAAGGTVEIRHLTLADAVGEVMAMQATAVPNRDGTVMLAGTVTTVCPATVAAAFAGTVPAPERRTRLPVRLAFEGQSGAVKLGVPADLPSARRTQIAPCPLLRGR